jgi:hypothetical protein
VRRCGRIRIEQVALCLLLILLNVLMEQVAWLLQVIGFGARVGPRNLLRGSDSGNEHGLFG